jgi:hypothetical protein
MHPFMNWLKTNNHVIPFAITKEINDWVNLQNGNCFTQYLTETKTALSGLKIKRIHLSDTAKQEMYGLYAKQFGGTNLVSQPEHSNVIIAQAERKRYQVLNECDDLLAIYICNMQHLNQVQYWALRLNASTNAILMNIASITILTSLAERYKNNLLSDVELEILNQNEDPFQRIMTLLMQVISYNRVTFKDLTPDQIENPSKYYDEVAKPYIQILNQ